MTSGVLLKMEVGIRKGRVEGSEGTLLIYDHWGEYTLSKKPGGWYTAYTRVYPPIHHCIWKSRSRYLGLQFYELNIIVVMCVVASSPRISAGITDGCILAGQNISLTCEVTYSGTNLMPMSMRWRGPDYRSSSYYIRLSFSVSLNTVNSSSLHQSTYTYTANGASNYTQLYSCQAVFSSPTGLVISGVQRQDTGVSYNTFISPIFISPPPASEQ